jgi:carbamate kinase
MEEKRLAVVALGGNAILDKKRGTDIHAQFQATRESMAGVVELLKADYRLLITHGNGPQVGNIMLMVENSRNSLPETPLGVADAMTCGSIGYMIEQSLQNTMIKNGLWRNVVTVPAQVVVDPARPGDGRPHQAHRSRFTPKRRRSELAAQEHGWVVKEDAGRGWRRYVASPYPLDIIEKDSIRHLIDEGYLVISGGGGGIPVYWDENGPASKGLDCVVDKDLASMKLALAVGARELIIITGVPRRFPIEFRQAEARNGPGPHHPGPGPPLPAPRASSPPAVHGPQDRRRRRVRPGRSGAIVVLITDVENLPGSDPRRSRDGDRFALIPTAPPRRGFF